MRTNQKNFQKLKPLHNLCLYIKTSFPLKCNIKHYSDSNAAPGILYAESDITKELKAILWMRVNPRMIEKT